MQTQGPFASEAIRYRSKKDLWLIVVYRLGPLVLLILGIVLVLLPQTSLEGWVLLVLGVLVWVLLLGLTYPVYYDITPSSLLVRFGLRRWEIPLSSIQQVGPVRYPSKGPALSMDRLQVDYKQDNWSRFLVISPEDKLRFLHDLAASASDLEVQDGSLVPRR